MDGSEVAAGKRTKTEFRHPIRGLLLGPMAVPIAYWIVMAADAMLLQAHFRWDNALAELVLVLGFGLPVAYATALVWGAPAVFVLYRLGILRVSTMVIVGALGGVIVGLWFGVVQEAALFRVRVPVPLGALLGALAGGVCWWAGRAAARPPTSPRGDSLATE